MQKSFYAIAALAVLALTSCSKLRPLSADDVKVTPTPLVCTAGEVPATITVTYPEKYMKKKASVTVTPVLKFAGQEALSQSASFQGEKVEGNGTEVNYKVGGTYTMKANYKWQDDMMMSDLYLRFDAKLKKKNVKLPDLKVGYGVIATSQLLNATLGSVNGSLAADNFQRVIAHKQEANIKYLINQSNVRKSETSTQSIKDLVAVLKEINDNEEGRVLNSIEVSAYASPDGKLSFNEKLAEKRQNTSSAYLKDQLKKIKMNADIDTKFTAEDWEGFQQLIEASNIQDKQVILSVLKMYQDPEEREQQIRNMSAIFTDIKDGIMPELRRARLLVSYEVIGRSDEQILAQFNSDASQLSVEELLYAANMLVTDAAEREAWYKKTTQLYPTDYRAFNNLYTVARQQGDQTKADAYLLQAQKVNQNAAEINTNLALTSLLKGDANAAETYLAKGSGADSYNVVLGAYNIARGNYAQASTQLAGTNTSTEALAEILNDNYAAAKTTLDNAKSDDAVTAYLKAVLAARQGDTSAVVKNLTTAIAKDKAMGARAIKDLEFAKYASTVQGLVK